MLPRTSPCPHLMRWVAHVACLLATALALSGEEAQHARFRCARTAPRWLESAYTLWKSAAPAGRPSPSVHGRALTCQLLCSRGKVDARHCARSLWGESAAFALVTCARRAALVGDNPYLMKAYWASRTAVSLVARPCSDVPALVLTSHEVGCACSAFARHYAVSLSRGSAARALATCVRAAALVGVGPYSMKPHLVSGTADSLSARPCSDVSVAASKREAYLRTCASQTAQTARALSLSLTLSQEEAQHARLRRARAAPRWLESVHTPWKPTAPAGRPSPSVHGRAPTCQPRPPNEKLTCVRAKVKQRKPRALSLSLRTKRSTRACDVRAPRRAG